MIDVHPPHESVHTWRDFFIHIATICVGLLIAIGLEQTVEWLHRGHERRELIVQLRNEAKMNQQSLQSTIDSQLILVRWEQDTILALKAAPISEGNIVITIPMLKGEVGRHGGERTVWPIAKANGKAGLLSDNLAEVYQLVDGLGTDAQNAQHRADAAYTAVRREQLALGVVLSPGATVTLPADHSFQLQDLIAAEMAEQRQIVFMSAGWRGASQAILDGVHDRTNIFPHMAIESLQALRRYAEITHEPARIQ